MGINITQYDGQAELSDAELIQSALTDIPLLVEEITRQQAVLESLPETLYVTLPLPKPLNDMNKGSRAMWYQRGVADTIARLQAVVDSEVILPPS